MPYLFCSPKLAGCAAVVLLMTPVVRGQIPMPPGPNGSVNLFNSDLAVLESAEVRKDLPCTVTSIKPVLGFDLRFHSGFELTVPLKELAGAGNALGILFRVTPESHPNEPRYFTQRVMVPVINDDARGEAYLQGAFDVGEGKYHVEWLMRDRTERVCSNFWDMEAALNAKERQMSLDIPPSVVERTDPEQFKEEPPIQRTRTGTPLRVKVLVNFAPQQSLSATLQPADTSALVSILRNIARDPRLGNFSVTAFNMQEQRVVYRQADAERIDFPALGNALTSLNLGTVNLKRLGDKHGDTDFLANLIKTEVGGQNHPDAVIFAGPKIMLDSNVPSDSLDQVGDVDFPVFYMNYILQPAAVPWKDAISHTIKYFGGIEYTISRPRDVWFAVSEMMTRIVKSRNVRQSLSISKE